MLLFVVNDCFLEISLKILLSNNVWCLIFIFNPIKFNTKIYLLCYNQNMKLLNSKYFIFNLDINVWLITILLK